MVYWWISYWVEGATGSQMHFAALDMDVEILK